MQGSHGAHEPGANRRHAFPAEIASLGILAVLRGDDENETLVRELLRTRASVRRLWPLPARLPDDADIIFCELVSDLPQSLPWLPGQPTSALVTIIPPAQWPDLTLLRNCAPHAVLHHPVTANTVLTSLMLARAQFLYERRLWTRIDKLDEALRAFHIVERAKAILMQTRKLGEDEAYHFLRRQAMDRRVSISALATAIVDSHTGLG
jgi:AmiR/NasT family two-component response regulator